MEYRYIKVEETQKKLKARDGSIWPYIPQKTFLEKEMDKESIIFGDVTGQVDESAPRLISMQQGEEKRTMRIRLYRSKLSFFDQVSGYMMAMAPTGKEGYVRVRKKSPLKISIAIGLLLVVLARGITAALWDRGPSLDKNAIAYQMPGGIKNTDPESIMLPGFDTLVMNYATQKVDIALLNPEGNECLFKYHIILKDSGKELYKTGLIKPGTAVTSFEVQEKLEKGKYPIVVKVDTADLKDPEKLFNGGAVEAVLEVK